MCYLEIATKNFPLICEQVEDDAIDRLSPVNTHLKEDRMEAPNDTEESVDRKSVV